MPRRHELDRNKTQVGPQQNATKCDVAKNCFHTCASVDARTASAPARDGRATRRGSRDHHRPGTEVNRRELSYDAKWTFRTPIGFNSLRPVAVRISPAVRVAGAVAAITPIPASPTAAVTPEAAASGDASMGPANVHMGPANVRAGPASAEVTAAEVAATKVSAASVSATSVTASTTSNGHCRDCRTAQKDSCGGYEQCFSQHQYLHHSVSSTKRCRRIFPSSTQSSGRRRQVTTCAMRKLSASASSAIKLSVRVGCSRRYRRAIPQSSEILSKCSRCAAFAATWSQAE
jgi:hypothetical protein